MGDIVDVSDVNAASASRFKSQNGTIACQQTLQQPKYGIDITIQIQWKRKHQYFFYSLFYMCPDYPKEHNLSRDQHLSTKTLQYSHVLAPNISLSL
jgi:hypothetical protein